jgi:hypothetical protein
MNQNDKSETEMVAKGRRKKEQLPSLLTRLDMVLTLEFQKEVEGRIRWSMYH